jgi:hypothetical protein
MGQRALAACAQRTVRPWTHLGSHTWGGLMDTDLAYQQIIERIGADKAFHDIVTPPKRGAAAPGGDLGTLGGLGGVVLRRSI